MTDCTDGHKWAWCDIGGGGKVRRGFACDHLSCGATLSDGEAEAMLNELEQRRTQIADLQPVYLEVCVENERLKSAEFWSDWVYPEGAKPEDIQNELIDFKDLIDRFSKVLFHSTGGRMSKSNYTVEAMCSEIDNYYAEGLA